MNEIIKLLDKNLEYVKNIVDEEYIRIWVEPSNTVAECPYCKTKSSKVHSRYERSFEDLPIQNKKVIIILNNKKFFCNNKKCKYKTFAQKYDFLQQNGKKTKRLKKEIIDIFVNTSSITASKIISKNITNISKSTICYYLNQIINFEYLFFEKIYNLVLEFTKILINKNCNLFENWIEDAKKLENKYINSFLNGISKDIQAVKNAINMIIIMD